MDFLKSLNRKQLIGLAILIFLLVAIPLTFYLVRQQQVIRSRAQEDLTLTLFQGGQQLQGDNPLVSDRNIQVRVTYTPPSVPSPSPSPSPAGTPVLNAQVVIEIPQVLVGVSWLNLSAADTNWFMVPVNVGPPDQIQDQFLKRLVGTGCTSPAESGEVPAWKGVCSFIGLTSGRYVFVLIHNDKAVVGSNEITIAR